MTDEEKLYGGYYQPDRLWTGGKVIKELHKNTSMSRKDITSWLAKQALYQVHIPPPKEINHPYYDVTKPNEQHQFDLLYMPHNVFEGNTYKYILTGLDVASRYKVARPLRTKKSSKVALVLEAIYKWVGCLNIPKYFHVIMGLSLKMKWQSCLKNTMLMFEERQRKISILILLLWKPLTKSWQNSCLNRWISKTSRTVKKYRQFGLKIWIKLWTKWTIQYRRSLVWNQRMQLNCPLPTDQRWLHPGIQTYNKDIFLVECL